MHCFIDLTYCYTYVKKPEVKLEQGKKTKKELKILHSNYVCWGVNTLLFQSGSLAFLEELLQILRASESRCQSWSNYGVLYCNLKVIKQVSTEATHVSKEGNHSLCKQVRPLPCQIRRLRCPGHEDKTFRCTNEMWNAGFELYPPLLCWLLMWWRKGGRNLKTVLGFLLHKDNNCLPGDTTCKFLVHALILVTVPPVHGPSPKKVFVPGLLWSWPR